MPIYANNESKAFWQQNKKRSRSLAATRFANLKTAQDGSEEEGYRKTHATNIKNGAVHPELIESRADFTAQLEEQGATTIYAKLEARLILNAGDGVIENGGICLDRNSGVPFIPGSAIKGCGRRHAIWNLSHEESDESAAQALADICLIFGYGDQEWKAGRDAKKGHSLSDFWLAMSPLEDAGEEHDDKRNERWETVSVKAKTLICETLKVEHFPKQLSGSVTFLPSYPEKDPGIDLDIGTCHHSDYYNPKKNKTTATDDENPIPVIYPTIPTGTFFHFCLLPSRGSCDTNILTAASKHLSEGLQIFGLGAKTNAGYGWFRIDEAAAKKAQDTKEAAALAESGPDPALLKEINQLNEKNQLAGKLNAYAIDESMFDRLWPKSSTIAYELALFTFVKEEASELINSKKGGKAMKNLAKKLNQTL